MKHELRIMKILIIRPLKLFLFLSIIPYSLFLIHSVGAQELLRTITIVPPSREHSLNPGETAEGILKVVNDSNEPITFNAVVRDYIVKDNQGTPEILPPDTLSNKYSASSWIGVYPSTFTIQPHQRQVLNYYLQVPPNASPGGHYAATIYEPTRGLGVAGTGAGVQTQIGTLFYIHVKGDIRQDARVLRFEAPGFSEYGPVAMNTEILNNGDLHIKPKGTITVKNMLGQKVVTQPLEEHNIFPERAFLYKNDAGGKWMFGRYTAQFIGTYGLANNLPLVATTSFIVFPWKVATIIALLVIIIILAVVAVRRRNKKHEAHEDSSHETHPIL